MQLLKPVQATNNLVSYHPLALTSCADKQLELDVKGGFAPKESTVAVYLDICKAYDYVWIHGLVFKLASIGANGCFLGEMYNFLAGRVLFVSSFLFMSFFP